MPVAQTRASRCVNPTGDELPEFDRSVLEVLRQPLEDGHVTIVRAAAALTYPARFTLVASMNPCPCGFFGDPVKACTCSPNAVQRYLQKISGPLLDRIDIHMEVPRLDSDTVMSSPQNGERSETIRLRVEQARGVQRERFGMEKDVALAAATHCNAHMTSRQIQHHCQLSKDGACLLRAAIDQMHLSARAYDRILKLSRTIADLANEEEIGIAHVAEAVQYRALDRKLWG